jgi:hypothetical protein
MRDSTTDRSRPHAGPGCISGIEDPDSPAAGIAALACGTVRFRTSFSCRQ